jgi:hypothetical protein
MGTNSLTFPGRLAHQLINNKEVIAGDDGFYVYWPTNKFGTFDSRLLRQIADFLDWLNEPWQKQIEEYFKDQNNA